MKITRALAAMLVVLTGARTTASAQHTGGMSGHDMVAMSPMDSADAVALLTGAFGSSSAGGTATVKGTAATIAWAGDKPGARRVWYLHKGTCQRDLGAVGGGSPLVVGNDGKGTGSAVLAAPLASAGDYFVAVHESDAPTSSAVMACGALRRAGMAGTPGMAGGGSQSMQGMDMSGMAVSKDGGMAGMNMPGMPPSAGGAAAHDHAQMGHAMPGAGTMSGMSGMDSSAGITQTMVELHIRMLSDSVIRRRVAGDTALRRMMTETAAAMPEEHRAMMLQLLRGAGTSAGASRPATPVRKSTKPTARPATKPTTKPAAKPATKPTKPAKPASKDSMPGMHMPGMNMPGMGKP